MAHGTDAYVIENVLPLVLDHFLMEDGLGVLILQGGAVATEDIFPYVFGGYYPT